MQKRKGGRYRLPCPEAKHWLTFFTDFDLQVQNVFGECQPSKHDLRETDFRMEKAG
jgi:hypothetical protein